MDNLFQLLDVLKYGIMIVTLLGLSAALLSPFIVLNEQSLIADGLSHVSFTALAIGFFFIDEPFYIAIPIVILASIFIKWISRVSKIGGDAALGMVSSVGFSIGLIIIKFSTTQINLESLITGNLWLRKIDDVYLSLAILIMTLVLIIVKYRDLLSLTYDEEYAKFKGVKVGVLSYVLAALTGIFVVVGVRSIGVLLISSLLIFPVVTANLFAKSFKDLFLIGIPTTLGVVLVGIFGAHLINIPAGSMIVLTYMLVYFILLVIKKVLKKE